MILPSVYLNIRSPEENLNLEENYITNDLNLISAAEYWDPEDNPYSIPSYNELQGRIPVKKDKA